MVLVSEIIKKRTEIKDKPEVRQHSRNKILSKIWKITKDVLGGEIDIYQ